MKRLIITFLVIFNSVEAFCQHQYIQDLSSVAQITFPDTPKVEFSNGATYYSRQSNRQSYFAQVVDLNKINPDSLDHNKPNQIYDQFITSSIRPLKGEVFYRGTIENGGIKGVSFDYKCELKGNTYYTYQYVYHVNDALISYSVLSIDSLQKSSEILNAYFSTFKLTPQKAADLNKKSGILAAVLMFSFAIFWTAVIIYIIKRSRKKKKYVWPNDG